MGSSEKTKAEQRRFLNYSISHLLTDNNSCFVKNILKLFLLADQCSTLTLLPLTKNATDLPCLRDLKVKPITLGQSQSVLFIVVKEKQAPPKDNMLDPKIASKVGQIIYLSAMPIYSIYWKGTLCD